MVVHELHWFRVLLQAHGPALDNTCAEPSQRLEYLLGQLLQSPANEHHLPQNLQHFLLFLTLSVSWTGQVPGRTDLVPIPMAKENIVVNSLSDGSVATTWGQARLEMDAYTTITVQERVHGSNRFGAFCRGPGFSAKSLQMPLEPRDSSQHPAVRKRSLHKPMRFSPAVSRFVGGH